MERNLVELPLSCAGYVWNHTANRLLQQVVGIHAVDCAGSSVLVLPNFVPFANESQAQVTCVEYIFDILFYDLFPVLR
jgi:hypothetical protein